MPRTELQKAEDTRKLDTDLNGDLDKYSYLLDNLKLQKEGFDEVETNKALLEKQFGINFKNTDPKVVAELLLLRLQEIQIHENAPTVFTVSQEELSLKSEIEYYLANLTQEFLSLDEATELLESQESNENGVAAKIKELREELKLYQLTLDELNGQSLEKNNEEVIVMTNDEKLKAIAQTTIAIKSVNEEIGDAVSLSELLKRVKLN